MSTLNDLVEGVFIDREHNSTLVIFGQNGPNTFLGRITVENITIPVTILENINIPRNGDVDFAFSGANYSPNEFVGGAGRMPQGQQVIQIAGGFPTENGVQPFQGNYERA